MASKLFVMTLLATVLLTGAAFAERATFAVGDTEVVTRGEGPDAEACALLSFQGMAALRSGVSVSTAQFRVPLGVERPEGRVVLQLHPVLGSWGEYRGAFGGRTDPPGGEFYREIYSRARLDEGGESLVFDLTGILTEIQDGLAVNGLVVTAPGNGDRGLDSNTLRALNRLSEGSLEVTYRRVADVPERATARGDRNRSVGGAGL